MCTNLNSSTWKAIRTAMIRNDITSISHLAEISGINPSTLQHTRRKNPESFILYELIQLDKTLGFTPEEWEQMKGES